MEGVDDEGAPSKWIWQPPPPPAPRPPSSATPSQELFHVPPAFLDAEAAGDGPSKPSRLPPGTRLVDILGATFSRFWSTSHTLLRLDLRRALRLDGPVVHSRDSGSPRNSYHTNHPRRTHDFPEDWAEENASPNWLQGIHGGGARLKLMQIWDFRDKETSESRLPWDVNVGIGANVEMDKGGHLELEARIKAKHLALYILPMPLLELRGKWPLGGTRLALSVRYRIPLRDLENFWESPTAHLHVNLYSPVGTGFHLSPGGLEFDEHVVNIGQHTKLRAAASIEFPRKLPLEEGEQPIRIHIDRLGIKSRIS